ncbi:PDR/VanB family oxidoreductase [Streptomyces sp. NPDC059398]|uniref:PDR/VanB family oxidoreductase n=1 Tax=Streptomyces sp. NPDC059398 TaxID=3346820 RepID=UPI0036C5F6A5
MQGDAFDVVVRARTRLARSVVEFELAAPAGSLPAGTPGAHIDLELPSGRVRQYSLYSGSGVPGTWRIAVLREDAGRGGSAELHDEVAVGTRLRAVGPRNRFPLHPSGAYLFIAGGIGITPLLPMVEQAEQRGAQWQLVYGGRSRESMAFLPRLARYGEKVRVVPQDTEGLPRIDTLLSGLPDGALVYCCGPQGLLDAVGDRCSAMPPGSLHTERFTPTGERPADSGGTAFDAVLERSGRTVRVPAGTSVLQAVRDAGVAVLASCEEGTCGTCETGVLGGVPEHRDTLLTADERAANDLMLICVSRSHTPQLVLDL